MKKTMLVITLLIFSTLVLSACNSNSSDNNDNESHTNDKDNKSETNLKVVIDPGHGGKDKGATGASGKYEKSFNLSLSKKVEKLLKDESGIDVFMTRSDDSFISQEDSYRTEYPNKLNADLFISIHGNTFSDPNVSGTETFYYHKNSRSLAEVIQNHVAEATGFRDRGVKKKDLFVVKDTEMPAALLEVGYLTNAQDESKMRTDDFQSRVATSIVEGIKEYKESSKKQGILEQIF